MVEDRGAARDPLVSGVHETLGISVTEVSPERVVVTLPVSSRVHQGYGIVHGGVSALLAESAASIGAGVSVAPGHRVVGIELNASHLRAVREGTLTAAATPVRKGRRIQVWRVTIVDAAGRPTCEARCTLAVLGPEEGLSSTLGPPT
jgi:1,4-dihydroxy-2-naphthoyl-CoA hydrolase